MIGGRDGRQIVSWGVKFDLNKKCDGSHEHSQCAGRETKGTQTYTDEIVSIIMKIINCRMSARWQRQIVVGQNDNSDRQKRKTTSKAKSCSSHSCSTRPTIDVVGMHVHCATHAQQAYRIRSADGHLCIIVHIITVVPLKGRACGPALPLSR